MVIYMHGHYFSSMLKNSFVCDHYHQAWRRAGDALGSLRQYGAAIEYYEVAIRLDPALSEALLPAVEKLRLTKKLLDNAAARGFDADEVLALVED